MSRNEEQIRRYIIDHVLSKLGWTNDLINIEVTPGGIDIIDGNPKRRQGKSGIPSLQIHKKKFKVL
jgi:hypothetical protein